MARRAAPLVEWILKSRDTERIVMALLGGFAVPENAGYVAGCVKYPNYQYRLVIRPINNHVVADGREKNGPLRC